MSQFPHSKVKSSFLLDVPVVVLLPLLKPKLIIFHYNGGKQLPTKVEFVRFLITSMKCKINFQLNGKITELMEENLVI